MRKFQWIVGLIGPVVGGGAKPAARISASPGASSNAPPGVSVTAPAPGAGVMVTAIMRRFPSLKAKSCNSATLRYCAVATARGTKRRAGAKKDRQRTKFRPYLS
jgi:hypothetical protein